MRDSLVNALLQHAASDDKFCLITADLGFGVFDEYVHRFPDKFLNVGVAEQNMASIAAGMALEGWKVVAYSIGNFPTFRCLEQLRNDVCYHDLDVKIVGMGGGFSYGILGMSHHATEDIAIMRALPGMRIYTPSGKWDARQLLPAMLDEFGPAYIRLDKSVYEARDQYETPVLGGATLLRRGRDITLAVFGGITAEVVEAAERLSQSGIEAEVVLFHSLRPFDGEILGRSLTRTGRLITVEEHSIVGGLGSAAAEYCLENGVRVNGFHRIGLRDTFSKIVGDATYLRHVYGMSADAIVDHAKSLVGIGRPRIEASGNAG